MSLGDEDFNLKNEILQNLISKMGNKKENQYKVLGFLSAEDEDIIEGYCLGSINLEDPVIIEF